jgi:hypothetical protein
MEVRQAIPLSTRGLFIIAQERERETLDELVNSTLLFCLVLAAPKKGWSSSAYHMKSDLLGCNSLFASLYRLWAEKVDLIFVFFLFPWAAPLFSALWKCFYDWTQNDFFFFRFILFINIFLLFLFFFFIPFLSARPAPTLMTTHTRRTFWISLTREPGNWSTLGNLISSPCTVSLLALHTFLCCYYYSYYFNSPQGERWMAHFII